MALLLCELLSRANVAVISGASFAQFEKQFLAYLTCPDNSVLGNLSVLPTNGSAFYAFVGGEWKVRYQHSLSAEDKKLIMDSVASVIAEPEIAAFFDGQQIYGKQLEDRDSQIAFSAVGQEAPIDAKQSWDPDHMRRETIIAKLQPMLPNFQLSIGGMTTIDITQKGIDKEYGINRLSEILSIPKGDIVYVGDALFPGGNDYPAIAAGVPTQSVKNVSETKDFIRKLISGV